MRSVFRIWRSSFSVAQMALGLCLAIQCAAAPAINSVAVNPEPLLPGQAFTVTASTSSDVVQAVATVDFRPWSTSLLRVTLAKQGADWVGSGVVPASLQPPANAQATVKVLVFDAARQRAEFSKAVSVVSAQAITAVFDPNTGVLTITGNNQANAISVRRDPAGNILVNGGTVAITGGVPTVANTVLIRAFGLDSNDQISVDESGGALPIVNFFGGGGADLLIGGSTADVLNGGPDADTIEGRGGVDQLIGEGGADVLTGGDGADLAFGGEGDDTFVWNPGDDSDTLEGQGGVDTMLFNGANVAENIDLVANGSRLIFFRSVGSVAMDTDDVERIIFNALGGADVIVVGSLSGTDVTDVRLSLEGTPGLGDGAADRVTVNGTQGADVIAAADVTGGVSVSGLPGSVTITGIDPTLDELTINGLSGDDVIDATGLSAGRIVHTQNGGLGDDVLLGSQGDDLINGGDGDDLALCGAGNDTFVWNPGDDNDTIEGQDGFDSLLFTGANVAEQISLFANGGRLVFFRDVASVVMDANDLEQVLFNARGGADTISVGDLSGTDVTEISLNLEGVQGSGNGDSAADNIIVSGTSGDDVILVVGDATGVAVFGLATQVNIFTSEAALDRLTINALGGDDVIEASGLAAGAIQLTGNGGANADVLIGSDGNDILLGGDGDDVLIGGPGLDVLDGGAGDNIEIQD